MIFFDAGQSGHAVLAVDFFDHTGSDFFGHPGKSRADHGDYSFEQSVVYPGTNPPPQPR